MDCNNLESAKAFAKTMPNELVCSPISGKGVTCRSESKTVTILDIPSGKTYKFNVYHELNSPFLVKADEWQLDADSQVAFFELAKFARAFENTILKGSQTDIQVSLSSNQTTQMFNSVEECPLDTALAILTDPNAVQGLRDKIFLRIAKGITEEYGVDNTNSLRPTATVNSLNMVFRGQQFSATSAKERIFSAYVEAFENTERPTKIADYIAFDIGIVGWDSGERPISSLEISGASRVAGFSLSALKGENGPLLIDNDCITSQLDNAAALGIFEKRVTPISSVGKPGSIEKEDAGSSGDVIQQTCEIIDLYQGGERRFTYRKCQ